MKTLALLALLVTPCLADEVVMKDGRKIEFRSIEDTGDTYTIVTPESSRIVVKRADVEAFAKTEPATPLTGASVSFDRKSKLDTVDLLKKVSFDKGVVDGSWKFVGAILTGAAGPEGAARLQISCKPSSEEYNLTLVIERADGDDNVGIGFLTPGGGSAMLHLDVDRGAYSGILAPEGASGHKKVCSAPGKQLNVGKPRTVVLMVRKASLVVQVDGKDLLTSRIDWTKVSILPQCAASAADSFVLFALKSGVRVSKMTVSAVAR